MLRSGEMSFGKMAIATASLLATLVCCEWFATKVPPTNWGYAISVNFLILAVASALSTSLDLPMFPASYFVPQKFERSGRIYRWSGIRLFVGFLRLIGWERYWRTQIPIRKDLDALRTYFHQTQGSEAVHVVAGICTIGLILSIAVRSSLLATKWLWVANLLINLYPVMLQRYNRPRVERLIRRLERDAQPGAAEQTHAREVAVADGTDMGSSLSPPVRR